MELHTALSSLLMPPFAPLVGLLVALFLYFLPASSPAAKLSLPLAMLCILALWVCATPVFSGWLGRQLVARNPVEPATKPSAVVILGGGRYRDAITGNERLSVTTMERVVWAVTNAPKELPILVSGGRVYRDEQASEAGLMAGDLEKLFSRPVTWRDNCSRTTAENASNSAALLHDSGVESIVLVTHWWHMPRAAEVFARAGLQVQQMPVGSPGELLPRGQGGILLWLPSAGALLRTQIYWREILADFWYRWHPLPEKRVC